MKASKNRLRPPILPIAATFVFATLLVLSYCPAKVTGDVALQPSAPFTVDQWVTWRDSQIAQILTPTFETNGETLIGREKVISACPDINASLQSILSLDPNYFKRDPARFRAMKHFLSFVAAQSLMSENGPDGKPDHALGYTVTDRDYWASVSQDVSFPPLLRSQRFLQEMSTPATYKAAIDEIDRQNDSLPEDRKWIVLPFRGQFIKSVDKTTYGRMLVLAPNIPTADGGTIDQWVQFAIATPDLNPVPTVCSVSVVAVHRSKSDPSATRTSLVDFMRGSDESSGQVTLTPTMLLGDDPSHNCYDCHKSGVIPIKPEATFSFDKLGRFVEGRPDTAAIDETINKRITSYGRVDLGPMDIDAYGPCLGSGVLAMSDKEIRAAAPDTSLAQVSCVHIRDAMMCASCHNRSGKLNYLQAVRSNFDVKVFKSGQGMVQTYIENGWMPPGNGLNHSERHALWECLSKQYYNPHTGTGQLVDWLKGDD